MGLPAHARLSKLPALVRLGRGYAVRVLLVAPTQLQEILEEDDPHLAAGCWSIEDYHIYIDNTLSRQRQWETYFHELQHAVHDIAELNRGGI